METDSIAHLTERAAEAGMTLREWLDREIRLPDGTVVRYGAMTARQHEIVAAALKRDLVGLSVYELVEQATEILVRLAEWFAQPLTLADGTVVPIGDLKPADHDGSAEQPY